MDLGIAGRRAAVAAASSGLGFSCAKALAAEGVAVAICGREEDRLARASAELGGVPAIRADLRSVDQAVAFVRSARERLGGLDILVVNSGGPRPGALGEVGLEDYRDAVDLNLMSAIAMVEEALPQMREQKWGRIVAITSITVRQPRPDLITSNTIRAAVTGYLETVADAVAGDGVTVNSVQPGSHATERLRQLAGDLSAVARRIPVGFVGDPDDFGAVVAFLCSERARFITGTSLLVDGGEYRGIM